MIRHKTFYIDKIEELEYCDSKILCLTGGEYEIPFTIEPSETDHNLDNCEGCKKHHSLLVSEFEEKLNIFPNCCDGHRKLARLKEFDKKDFLKAPEWCSDKIMYSYHHFMQHIDSDEWYEEITSYFEYCIESYGSTPPQCGSPFELGNYFSCLEHLINENRYILKSDKFGKKQLSQRIAKIKNYLDSYYEENNQIDKNINILLSKYNEWYNLFPFELDYFEPLREQFRLSIPIFKKRKKFNKYLGSTRLEVHTVESLTNILLNTTNEIISKINGLSLYKKGDLNNPKKIQLDLILQNRKLELIEIGSIDNTSRKGYIKTLKSWFRTEKKFIKEITPFLKDAKSNETESAKPTHSIKQIALKLFYIGDSVTRENCNEIIKEYGYTSGESLYQHYSFFSSTANRKANPHPLSQKRLSNKIKLFESVIEILPEVNKQRALDELKILKENYKIEFD